MSKHLKYPFGSPERAAMTALAKEKARRHKEEWRRRNKEEEPMTDKRVTIRLDEPAYRRFRMTAALLEKSMQECMELALAEWMSKYGEQLGDVIRQAEAITNPQLEDSGEHGRKVSHR